ncbi:MAG: YajG family lipoprotein [Gammaproteobacteria bacterium]|nr:YajG family lipoprotein [Gammaproteobacteria bacterium]
MPRLLVTLVVSLGLLSACALSPQVLDIYPQAHVSGPAYGQGRQIDIQVVDQRTSQILGSRGGVYDASSTITINNNLADAVLVTAQDALQQLGFNGNSSAQPAQMIIHIEQLAYDTKQKNLIYYVDLAATLKVTTIIAGNIHEGNYKTQGNHQFGQAPDAAKNASILNKLLSNTIDRAFSDPNLAKFMLNH